LQGWQSSNANTSKMLVSEGKIAMPVKGSKPGERRGGRKKGTPNKTTAVLKEAILLAAEQTGEDGKGKDGLVGYLRHVAEKEWPLDFLLVAQKTD
jgi:hypothetical protein